MAGEDEKAEGKGFKVSDRRRFSSETGEAKEASGEPETPRETPEGRSEATPRPDRSPNDEALPEINFSAFVISLSTQALMHLGEIANPLSGKVEADIPSAKQMIDIVGMLREKTQGNLNPGEAQLMEDVLFDLRMKYVEAVKKK
jgi:hypothetical protein